jgi:ABC-type Fe3+ transport system substrate-binding protein
MLKRMKQLFVTTLTAGLLTVAPISQANDWVSDWQYIMKELWGQTKESAQKGWEAVQPQEPVEIGIAYGTEKKEWLTWAVDQFSKTPQGKNVKINLIPMGSIEGAKAVLEQDKRIHVWSPASSLVQDLLVSQWQAEHGNDPIYSDAPLVLTPMVIVMWKDRYEAFMAKYQTMNFKTLSEALREKTGWAAIAQKPEWGLFTFGHTMPNSSNSGLLALALMAYDYADVSRKLKAKHIMDEGFLTWMEETQDAMSTNETSTGKLMDTMLRYGPSKLNAIIVYENLALSNLDTAKGRWGEIKVIYPSRSVWNDNPYYILDVNWSSNQHKNAAKLFQDFLLSKAAQIEARDKYLFRPANIDVPILGDGSMFDALKDQIQIDVATITRPKAEILQQLIQIWERNQ